ncbi:MAG: ABC transporter substrate-binding protein [Burkholderiales bacterium]
MRRRNFILATAAWPLAARAGAVLGQPKKAPVLIGWLHGGSREANGHIFAAFKDGLAALGWKEGSQVVFEERWANGWIERLQPLAEELAAKKPAVIVGLGSSVRAAAKAAPNTPVVQAGGADPVAAGLVKSLARPGGMITGVSSIQSEISEKLLELLLAAAPKLRRIGFLFDSTTGNIALQRENTRRSVAQYAVEARYAEVARLEEIEPAISRLTKEGAQALVLLPSQMFLVERRHIVKFALARRWPVIAGQREWADDGTLLSYGVDPSSNSRRAAYYVDRILKGAKPGDLPIEQPTRFELVINMKTARALKLEISRELAVRVDRVIE